MDAFCLNEFAEDYYNVKLGLTLANKCCIKTQKKTATLENLDFQMLLIMKSLSFVLLMNIILSLICDHSIIIIPRSIQQHIAKVCLLFQWANRQHL